MEFPCVKCGLCCRFVGLFPSMRAYDRGDGTCRYLDEPTRLCAVYETRPTECRVRETRPPAMTEAEWFEQNVRACQWLQRRAGWPEAERSVMP